MQVCIPIEFQPQGGGFYFLRSFEAYLKAQGHQVHKTVDAEYDLLFTNHWMVPPNQILRALRNNPDLRIVQRIDGAAQDYGRDPEADRRQRAVNKLVDLTIFQSQYCRYSTREKFPVILQDGPVIHNPVAHDIFNPEGPRLDFPEKVRVAAVSWSANPFKGAASIYSVAQANPDIGFVLCGRYSDAPQLPNLHKLGVLDQEELATALRSCQALLTFSRNEACPNHVLEALASGLPVLYIDSGAMAEVIGTAGLPVNEETFREQLDRMLADQADISRAARVRAESHFAPDLIFGRYLAELESTLQQPPRLLRQRRRLLLAVDRLLKPLRSIGVLDHG